LEDVHGNFKHKCDKKKKKKKVTVQYDPKLSDDSGEVPKPNGVDDGTIPDREIVSLLDGKLVRWSITLCVPKRKRKKREITSVL
jgi:hypothetical protein